jgi:hypothetical protein
VGDRQSEYRVENGKHKTGQQAQLPVHQRQVGANLLLQYHHELPVDEIKGIDECQQRQHIPAVCRAQV